MSKIHFNLNIWLINHNDVFIKNFTHLFEITTLFNHKIIQIDSLVRVSNNWNTSIFSDNSGL